MLAATYVSIFCSVGFRFSFLYFGRFVVVFVSVQMPTVCNVKTIQKEKITEIGQYFYEKKQRQTLWFWCETMMY